MQVINNPSAIATLIKSVGIGDVVILSINNRYTRLQTAKGTYLKISTRELVYMFFYDNDKLTELLNG